MKVLEIRIDFKAFAQLPTWIHPVGDLHEKIGTKALLERCLLLITLGWTRNLTKAVKPGRHSDPDRHAFGPKVQVRVPCLRCDAARETILKGALLDQYCDVRWTESGPVKYGGPAGYVSIWESLTKPPMCCELYCRILLVEELWNHNSKYSSVTDPKREAEAAIQQRQPL
jgi:hypothetical protein